MVNHFTRLSSSQYTQPKIDSKGRVFIPIRLRARLRFLEGTGLNGLKKIEKIMNNEAVLMRMGCSE